MTSCDTASVLTIKMKTVTNSKRIRHPLTIRWKGHNVCCMEHATIQHAVIQFCLDEVTNNNLCSTYSLIIYQSPYKLSQSSSTTLTLSHTNFFCERGGKNRFITLNVKGKGRFSGFIRH
jgi:hypothetical protein